MYSSYKHSIRNCSWASWDLCGSLHHCQDLILWWPQCWNISLILGKIQFPSEVSTYCPNLMDDGMGAQKYKNHNIRAEKNGGFLVQSPHFTDEVETKRRGIDLPKITQLVRGLQTPNLELHPLYLATIPFIIWVQFSLTYKIIKFWHKYWFDVRQ